MSDKVYIGKNVSSFESGGEYEPFSGVRMWYDDEHFYFAGDDSGRVMECECPWATQEIVNNILAQIKDYVYKPFEAKGAVLNPAAELGDAVTVGGVYSVIGSMTEHFDAMGATDIAAKGGKEIEHEYPYKSSRDRAMKRKVSLEQTYYGARISRREGLIIEKTDGETVSAKAVLNADELSFYDAGGGRVLYFDPGSGTYKFLGELNVNDKFVVDRQGNVKMAGSINMSGGSITWGGNSPVKYQFSTSMTGPWHDAMQTNDKYRRDSTDGGTTWGAAYQFVGTDGKNGTNGSDATVPKYITDTVIAKGVIEAPRINANKFSVFPNNPNDRNGGFVIHAPINGQTPEVFKIAYAGADPGPVVSITSPSALHIWWDTATTEFGCPIIFHEDVDFTGVNVKGFTATFG